MSAGVFQDSLLPISLLVLLYDDLPCGIYNPVKLFGEDVALHCSVLAVLFGKQITTVILTVMPSM